VTEIGENGPHGIVFTPRRQTTTAATPQECSR
jgi:hypothetical protein